MGDDHPCSCREENANSRKLLARLLIDVGRVLIDAGELVRSHEVVEDPLLGHELPQEYVLCKCTGTCCDRSEDKNGHYICSDTKNKLCDKAGTNCQCHLFRYKKSDDDSPWEHRADPDKPDPESPDNTNYFYKCLCVQSRKSP
jgi:hypothetical protein